MVTPDLLIVLRAIHEHAPINRIELAQRLGRGAKHYMPGVDNTLATPTRAAVATLMEMGLVRGTGFPGDLQLSEAGAQALGVKARGGAPFHAPERTNPRLIPGLVGDGRVTHRRNGR